MFKKIIKTVNSSYTNRQAFSIMEVMAAISIISVGMIGIMSLVTQNIQVANANQKELLAAQLAREGLELVRNRRDQNWIDGNDWKLGVGAGTQSDILQDRDYAIDYVAGITDIDGIDNALLKINGGFYKHNSGTATPFSRIIKIIQDDVNYIEIECEVRWQERGGARSYIASTVLYDWR